MSSPLMVLVAGPYRSGTGDDPARIAANHRGIPVWHRIDDVPLIP